MATTDLSLDVAFAHFGDEAWSVVVLGVARRRRHLLLGVVVGGDAQQAGGRRALAVCRRVVHGVGGGRLGRRHAHADVDLVVRVAALEALRGRRRAARRPLRVQRRPPAVDAQRQPLLVEPVRFRGAETLTKINHTQFNQLQDFL